MAHRVRRQKGIEAAWMPQTSRPKERDDKIERRQEEKKIYGKQKVKFASKPTAMFNAAGKISTEVNDYWDRKRRRSDEEGAGERREAKTVASQREAKTVASHRSAKTVASQSWAKL